MNIYLVTEGKTEAIVYKSWIPLVNPNLTYIESLDYLNIDNFYIVSAKGYPFYFEVIEKAILDVNSINNFDRLVIAIDSEDMTKKEKYNEVYTFIGNKNCLTEVKIVVQHFCFETWALGNKKILRTNPTSVRLREYKRIFNVKKNDPELLPEKSNEGLNRAKFAEKYLRLALNDKFRNLTYTKKNPNAVINEKYFTELKKRLYDTKHIASFNDFLDAFI